MLYYMTAFVQKNMKVKQYFVVRKLNYENGNIWEIKMHLHLLGNYLLSSQVRRISLLTVQEDWIPMIGGKKKYSTTLIKEFILFYFFF